MCILNIIIVIQQTNVKINPINLGSARYHKKIRCEFRNQLTHDCSSGLSIDR